MIATVRVLRVRARDAGQVSRAAGAVVAYLESGQPGAVASPAGYYAGERAVGRARGCGAVLVGLRGAVSGEALGRLLRGQHAVTRRPLLPATGSAGRVSRPASSGGGQAVSGLSGAGSGRDAAAGVGRGGAEWLTLAQAADVAGVGASYLRRLVGRTAQTMAKEGDQHTAGAVGVDERGDGRGAQAGRDGVRVAASEAGGHRAGPSPADRLVGERGLDGRWRIRRDELERWCAVRVAPATVLGVVHARDRLLVVLLAVTGVRIGEALGLRRETVGNGPERRSGASRSARSTMPSSIGTGRSRSTTMFLLRKAFKIVFSNDAAGVRSDERGALRRALRRRGRAGRGSLSPIRASPPFEPCR